MTDSPNSTSTGDNDNISASIGAGATNVAVGKQITQNIGFSADDVVKIMAQAQKDNQPAQQAVSATSLLTERQSFEPEIVLIKAGSFLMGSQPGLDIPTYETPQHQVTLAAYAIGKYPVTNAQYAEFVRQTGHPVAPESGWTLAPIGQQPPAGQEQYPVVGVSWDDAVAYCRWLREQTGRAYHLPSKAEWEKAARSDDGRCYPWGDPFDATRCNAAESGNAGATPVDKYSPMGDSPYGCADMAGNVWEWTSTRWGRQRTTPDFAYPYRPDDQRERSEAERGLYREYRVCRGGSWRSKPARVTCASRACAAADSHDAQRGLRVACGI